MSGLFGGGPKYTPPPTVSHESAQAAGTAERMRQRAARGQASTMLTGGSGVMGQANVGTKKLLGM